MLLTRLHRSQSLLPAWTASHRLHHVRHYVNPVARFGVSQTANGRPRLGPLSVVGRTKDHELERQKSVTPSTEFTTNRAPRRDIDTFPNIQTRGHGQNSNARLDSRPKHSLAPKTHKREHPNILLDKQCQSPSSTPKVPENTIGPKLPRKSISKLSLFEQLFPDEVGNTTVQAKKNGKFLKEDQPLLKEADWAKEWKTISSNWASQNTITTTSEQELADTHMAKGFDPQVLRRRRDASVLILSNASKFLAESDFLRLSTKGQHIEGWTSGIIKVIPGRDPQTLETLGHYFILFSTAAAARAYQDTVIRLHELARTHSPTPLGSPIPIPPGYIKDGEDLYALVQSFTLVPPSQPSVSLRMLHPEHHSPAIQRMIIQGGHPALVARQKKYEDLVLFSLNMGHSRLTAHELAQMLGRDAKERNLPWGLVGGDEAIVKLEVKRAEEDADADTALPDDARRRRRWRPPRFILSFKDAQEARRFVRAWHRRPLPVAPERISDGEEGPIVNAEVLW